MILILTLCLHVYCTVGVNASFEISHSLTTSDNKRM